MPLFAQYYGDWCFRRRVTFCRTLLFGGAVKKIFSKGIFRKTRGSLRQDPLFLTNTMESILNNQKVREGLKFFLERKYPVKPLKKIDFWPLYEGTIQFLPPFERGMILRRCKKKFCRGKTPSRFTKKSAFSRQYMGGKYGFWFKIFFRGTWRNWSLFRRWFWKENYHDEIHLCQRPVYPSDSPWFWDIPSDPNRRSEDFN